MEGVWIGSVLLSLHAGPLERKRVEKTVWARCSRLQGKPCVLEENIAVGQTGLTDVTLCIYQRVHGLSPCLESHHREARALIIPRYPSRPGSHACLEVRTQYVFGEWITIPDKCGLHRLSPWPRHRRSQPQSPRSG